MPTLLKPATLDTILRAFIYDFSDDELREQAAREMASVDRSLRTILTTINMEIKKSIDRRFSRCPWPKPITRGT